MSINRFSNLSTSSFRPLELQEIMMVPLARQQQHDKAQASLDEYSALQANRLSQDADAVDARLQELRGKSDDISTQLLERGASNDLFNKIRELKREREVEFSQQGLVGSAQANYKAATSFMNDLATKEAQQAGWSPARAKAWAQSQVAGFQGTDAGDGTFRQFQGQGLANKVDRNKWINDNLKNIAADSNPLLLKYAGNIDQFRNAYMSGEIESKDFNKIMSSLSVMAANDNDLMGSLRQEAFFTGEQDATNIGSWVIRKDPKTGKNKQVFKPGSSFGRQLFGAATGSQFRKVDYNYKILEDKAAWELFKSGLDKKEADTLVRAAEGEARTIRYDNIDNIRENVRLALTELTRQEALLNSFQGDKNSREYQELQGAYNLSKAKHNNLQNKINAIEKESLKTLTPQEKQLRDISKSLGERDFEQVMQDEGIEMEPVDTGYNSRPRRQRNFLRFLQAKGYNTSGLKPGEAEGLVREIGDKADNLTKYYLEQNPYSESYTEFGGLGTGKGTSTIGLVNKMLSENFQGANYSIAYEGTSLNAYIKDEYGDTETINEIRVTDGYDEMGNPIEHLIIKDKETGNIIETKAVTRGSNGKAQMFEVAKSLVNSNNPELVSKGQQMEANLTFMPLIKRSDLRGGGNAGDFFNKKVRIPQGDGFKEVPLTWEKRINTNGSTVWNVLIGDDIKSEDLYSENEIAKYLANIGKQ